MRMTTHRRLLIVFTLFALLVGSGARMASASLYHFYDGVSDPPPTFPSTGKPVAISSTQWAAQSFRASVSYSLTRVALWAQYSGNASDASTGLDPFVLLAIAAIPGAIAVGFLVWRGGRVEEVFLVHWSGVLVVHLSKTIKSATDRDILAGMLTTIQQFGREAFVEWKGRDIRRIDFGNQKIFLTRGLYSFLAVVVRGRKPGGLDSRTARTVAEFEGIFEGKLEEWDGALETLGGAEEILSEAMGQGGFARFTRWFIRSLRPPTRLPPSFHAHAQDGRRAKLSKQAGLRRLAGRLKQRRELNDIDENYQSLVATALEEVSEGRFTVCGFANIYLATVHHESSSQKNEAYWNAVLQLIRDVLQLWKWDPGSQAWVSERDESSSSRKSATELRGLEASKGDRAERPVLVAPVQAVNPLPRREEG